MRRVCSMLMLMVMALAGCRGVSKDLSDDPRYASDIGRQYRTKVELVLYMNKGTGGKVQLEVIGGSMSLPPVDKMPKKYPYNYYDAKLLGLLPTHSEFKVVKVKEEGQGFTRSLVEIEKSSDNQWIGKIVYPTGIVQPFNGNEAKFNPEYVEEIPAPEVQKQNQ